MNGNKDVPSCLTNCSVLNSFNTEAFVHDVNFNLVFCCFVGFQNHRRDFEAFASFKDGKSAKGVNTFFIVYKYK